MPPAPVRQEDYQPNLDFQQQKRRWGKPPADQPPTIRTARPPRSLDLSPKSPFHTQTSVKKRRVDPNLPQGPKAANNARKLSQSASQPPGNGPAYWFVKTGAFPFLAKEGNIELVKDYLDERSQLFKDRGCDVIELRTFANMAVSFTMWAPPALDVKEMCKNYTHQRYPQFNQCDRRNPPRHIEPPSKYAPSPRPRHPQPDPCSPSGSNIAGADTADRVSSPTANQRRISIDVKPIITGTEHAASSLPAPHPSLPPKPIRPLPEAGPSPQQPLFQPEEDIKPFIIPGLPSMSVPTKPKQIPPRAPRQSQPSTTVNNDPVRFPLPNAPPYASSTFLRSAAARFLHEYFDRYDNGRRGNLVDYYTPHSHFSFSIVEDPNERSRRMLAEGQLHGDSAVRFETPLIRRGRNLKSLLVAPSSNHNTTTNLARCPFPIINALRQLPETIHPISDPQRCRFDCFRLTDGNTPDAEEDFGISYSRFMICVSGEFQELPSKAIRSFDRTFILDPVSDGAAGLPFVILSDLLTIRHHAHSSGLSAPLPVAPQPLLARGATTAPPPTVSSVQAPPIMEVPRILKRSRSPSLEIVDSPQKKISSVSQNATGKQPKRSPVPDRQPPTKSAKSKGKERAITPPEETLVDDSSDDEMIIVASPVRQIKKEQLPPSREQPQVKKNKARPSIPLVQEPPTVDQTGLADIHRQLAEIRKLIAAGPTPSTPTIPAPVAGPSQTANADTSLLVPKKKRKKKEVSADPEDIVELSDTSTLASKSSSVKTSKKRKSASAQTADTASKPEKPNVITNAIAPAPPKPASTRAILTAGSSKAKAPKIGIGGVSFVNHPMNGRENKARFIFESCAPEQKGRYLILSIRGEIFQWRRDSPVTLLFPALNDKHSTESATMIPEKNALVFGYITATANATQSPQVVVIKPRKGNKDPNSTTYYERITLKAEPHKQGVSAICALPTTSSLRFATAGTDRVIKLWRVKPDGGEDVTTLETKHTSKILSLVWCAKQKVLISGGADSRVIAYNLETMAIAFDWREAAAINHVAVNPVDSNILLVCLATTSDQFRLYNLRTSGSKGVKADKTFGFDYGAIREKEPRLGRFYHGTFRQHLYAFACDDGLRIWDLRRPDLSKHFATVSSGCIHPVFESDDQMVVLEKKNLSSISYTYSW